jgi:hypothetical protein
MAFARSMGRGRTTALLLLAALILLVAAAAVGIPDNPPGIALMYLAVIVGITALVHRWREPRRLLRLFYGAVIGFAVFVLLHNLGYAVASVTELEWLRGVWEALSAGAFILAVVVAPAAFVVGGVGALARWLAGRR